LLIECVNNPQPMAFFTRPPVFTPYEIDLVKMSGPPVLIKDGNKDETLPHFLKMWEYHHYCHNRVATQWCSFAQKDKGRPKGWMAYHDDVHFNDIGKLCTAVEHYSQKHIDDCGKFYRGLVALHMFSLVLVFQGDLLEVNEEAHEL